MVHTCNPMTRKGWWYTLVIPACRRPKQENCHKSETSLGYVVRLRVQKLKTIKSEERLKIISAPFELKVSQSCTTQPHSTSTTTTTPIPQNRDWPILNLNKVWKTPCPGKYCSFNNLLNPGSQPDHWTKPGTSYPIWAAALRDCRLAFCIVLFQTWALLPLPSTFNPLKSLCFLESLMAAIIWNFSLNKGIIHATTDLWLAHTWPGKNQPGFPRESNWRNRTVFLPRVPCFLGRMALESRSLCSPVCTNWTTSFQNSWSCEFWVHFASFSFLLYSTVLSFLAWKRYIHQKVVTHPPPPPPHKWTCVGFFS